MSRSRMVTLLFMSVLMLVLSTLSVSAGDGPVHVVKAGETLNSIARQHAISVRALAQANGITNIDLIRVGQKLSIPTASGTTSVPAVSASAPQKPLPRTYTVRSGETLSQIAKRLGISVAGLVAANHLANADRIYPGMVLTVPGGTAPEPGSLPGPLADTRFIVRLSSQRCWLYKDGVLIGEWRCSSGRKQSPTAPGSYRIQSKIRDAYGSRWDFWMPYWLGVYYAHGIENGIHGLPYNKKTGRRTWEGLVGTRITYGCIMLDDVNAKTLYEVAFIGMPVVILR